MNAAPTISVRERFEIGVATRLSRRSARVVLGVSLFASSGAAKLVEVAYQAVK